MVESAPQDSVSYTQEEIIGSARQWEGVVDILQLMAGNSYLGFGWNKGSAPAALKYAQAIKESGAKVYVGAQRRIR